MKKHEEDTEFAGEASRSHEGVFDAQLSFPAVFGGAPEPIDAVIKRDGTHVPFETRKITESILKAAESTGEADAAHAKSLASGVAIYLGKTLAGQAPAVAQVQDAVERVLVEMGHVKTAMAYARYHRKRERARRLKQGDIRAIISAGAEPHAEPSDRGAAAGTLFVRTSDERLLEWERERIVDALVRETGMAYSLAESIAAEVETQVHAAQVRILTASLIRELVDAKLIEHGLEHYRKRHMRLGVPLYDAEQIVCAPNQGQYEGIQHPGSTDVILAERIKKEYALSQVFSQETADAHLAGDLHIHDLGLVDRLHAVSASLEYVRRFGPEFARKIRARHLAQDVETLVAHVNAAHEQLRPYVADSVRWEAFNVFAAPFLANHDPSAFGRFAELMQLGFRQQRSANMRRAANAEIMLCSDVPECLMGKDTVASAEDTAGKRYGDYALPARHFAKAVIDTISRSEGLRPAGPRFCLQIAESFWSSARSESFLELVAKAATAPGGPVIEFERAQLSRRVGSDHAAGLLSCAVLQRVTLNLPRVAYRARREAPLAPEQGFLVELRRLMNLAARAHAEKRDFIERLLMLKDLGPLSLLATEHEGTPVLDLEHVTYLVAVTGLNECVQTLAGAQLHESQNAVAAARRITAVFTRLCAEVGETHDIRLVPAITEDETLDSRFAMLDLDLFELHAQPVVKSNPITHDIGYTPGARLATTGGVNPMEQLRIEAILSDAFPVGGTSIVPIDDDGTSLESLGDFIRNVFYRTSCRRFRFHRP